MATANATSKSARLETRVTRAQKELIERAAAYSGRTVSEFVVTQLEAISHKVIADFEQVRLDKEQSHALVDALLSPSRPNKKLRGAMADYRKRVKSR